MSLRSLLPALAAGLLGACATATPLPDMVEPLNATLTLDPFTIQAGDRIAVQFTGNPQWNEVVRVRPDGTASFPLVGRLAVEGLTIDEVETSVLEAYQKTLREASGVTVDVPDLARRSVLVLGEVPAPGPVAFRERELSLVEALAQSGGPDWRQGRLGKTVLLRWFPKEKKRVAFQVDASLEYWGTAEQIWLQPDDIVFVPPKPVVVIGNWIDLHIRRLLPVPYLVPARILY